MGSSAMGATKFHNRIKAERPDLTVTNTSVDTIPADADVVVCQRILADRAAKSAPQAQLVTLDNFLADPHLDALYNALTSTAPVLDAKAEAAAKEQIEWVCIRRTSSRSATRKWIFSGDFRRRKAHRNC